MKITVHFFYLGIVLSILMLTCFLGDMSSPVAVNITTIKEDKYCLSSYCNFFTAMSISSVFGSSVIIFVIFRPSLTSGYSLVLLYNCIVFTLVVLNSLALF